MLHIPGEVKLALKGSDQDEVRDVNYARDFFDVILDLGAEAVTSFSVLELQQVVSDPDQFAAELSRFQAAIKQGQDQGASHAA